MAVRVEIKSTVVIEGYRATLNGGCRTRRVEFIERGLPGFVITVGS